MNTSSTATYSVCSPQLLLDISVLVFPHIRLKVNQHQVNYCTCIQVVLFASAIILKLYLVTPRWRWMNDLRTICTLPTIFSSYLNSPYHFVVIFLIYLTMAFNTLTVLRFCFVITVLLIETKAFLEYF